jgi:GNAT superfamily N-acetyltransferase
MTGITSSFLHMTLSPSSAYSHRKKNDELLDPEKDAAILKALYVHPDAGRKGVGRKLLKACEDAA